MSTDRATLLDMDDLTRYASTLWPHQIELSLKENKLSLAMAAPELPEGLYDFSASCDQCDASWCGEFENYPVFPGFDKMNYPNPVGCGHGVDYSCAWQTDTVHLDLDDLELEDEASLSDDLNDAIRDWMDEAEQRFKTEVKQNWDNTIRDCVANLEREADLILDDVRETVQQGAANQWGYDRDEHETIFEAIDEFLSDVGPTMAEGDPVKTGTWLHRVSEAGITITLFYRWDDAACIERFLEWPEQLAPMTPTN